MTNWDEIRTAYQVARRGTVSGAAEALGVHHATVIRHVDAVEARLGVKLFQRHARGYTPTEAGQDLLRVAQATDDQLQQLEGRIRGQGAGVAGELVVTSLPSMATPLVPVLTAFQAEHPGLVVRYLTGTRLFRLEYGEAHVAIRAGAAPEQPDNVVQPFVAQQMRLVASRGYLAAHGAPRDESALAGHALVGHDDSSSRAPFMAWLRDLAPRAALTFRTMDDRSMLDAIRAGAGIGFVPAWELSRHGDLVEVLPARAEWNAPLWLVTHVDQHRMPKVQAFLAHLKAAAGGWAG
ncbi:MAG: LysR family transcriptional regulator [Paracoccaceae bacterium]